MPALALRLLGLFEARVDGARADGALLAKHKALIAYVALHPGGVAREVLAGLLWGALGTDEAAANLRKTLTLIRKTPLGAWIDADRDAVVLRRDEGVTLDTETFEALVGGGLAERRSAIALSRGPFLDGLVLHDAPEFDEWLSAQRERFREPLINAQVALAEHALALGQIQEAAALAQGAIGLDAWREDAQRLRMRALAAGGRHTQALAQAAQLHDTLLRELRVAPSAETRRLERQIQRALLHPPQPVVRVGDSFVGRAGELALLRARLAGRQQRLITLLGPGGIGKSRLAAEFAHAHGRAWVNGAAWVALGALERIEALPHAIARAAGLDLLPGDTPDAQLARQLAELDVLLVLDNAETLAGPALARALDALLSNCPELSVLVTSRARISLRAEQVITLDGLEAGGEAQQLMLARLRRADPQFVPDRDQAGLIDTITRQLSGMPLGIELAAAWWPALGLADIDRQLHARIGALASRDHDVPERQRSLDAVVDSSLSRLDPALRDHFAALSIFRAPFSAASARSICGVAPAALARLFDLSLLARAGDDFRMHAVLQRVGADRLARVPAQAAAMAGAHAAHFTATLRGERRALEGRDLPGALARIDAGWPDHTAAWQTLCARGDAAALAGAVHALTLYGESRGRYAEARALLDLACAAVPAGRAAERLAAQQAWFDFRLGDLDQGRARIARALALLRAGGSHDELAYPELYAGALAWAAADLDAAAAHFEASLAHFSALDDDFGVAGVLNNLCQVNKDAGRLAPALALAERALALCRARNMLHLHMHVLNNLASVQLLRRDLAAARAVLREAEELAARVDQPHSRAVTLQLLGQWAEAGGNRTQAHAHLREALRLAQDTGDAITAAQIERELLAP